MSYLARKLREAAEAIDHQANVDTYLGWCNFEVMYNGGLLITCGLCDSEVLKNMPESGVPVSGKGLEIQAANERHYNLRHKSVTRD